MMMPKAVSNKSTLVQSISQLIEDARRRVATFVNSELTILYWNIGKQINEDILQNKRANYGKGIIAELSKELAEKYGSGFNKKNLHLFITFYELYGDAQIVYTLCTQFSWSHIRTLITIKDNLKREFYVQLCKHERWSVRTLQERMSSLLFERTAISKKPEKTITDDLELLKKEKKMSVDLAFRDPYFLDFLGLKDTYSENDLETSILSNLQKFLVEMGTDFAFIARQKRIIIDEEDYFIDLLFYHRSLKCLVAIDLKLDKFKAAYKGQMELYLRWLEHNEYREGEGKPIGLILCSKKSPEQIKYLMLDNHQQIKVSEYITQLPDKKLLQQKLEKAIALAESSIK